MSFFNDNGFLSEEGKRMLLEFNTAIENLMATDEVDDMSETEIRALGSVLAKIVGDVISNRISRKLQENVKFEAMSDDDFETYLKNKYGDNWVFMTLTPEEFKRVPTLDLDKLFKDIHTIGQSLMDYLNTNGVRYW
jgi:hypothetical protein